MSCTKKASPLKKKNCHKPKDRALSIISIKEKIADLKLQGMGKEALLYEKILKRLEQD
jgi:hypothetical protein